MLFCHDSSRRLHRIVTQQSQEDLNQRRLTGFCFELLQSAFVSELPAVEQPEAVAKSFRFFQLMRADDDCFAGFAKQLHEVDDNFRSDNIEPPSWFVKQNDGDTLFTFNTTVISAALL